MLSGAQHVRGVWQAFQSSWFSWDTVISVPWREPDHINSCEGRARLLGVRWVVRQEALHCGRVLFLLDSQVTLGGAASGRTGSYRMSHLHRKSSAHLVAGHIRAHYGYVRSEDNPADAGSRDLEGWARYRRESRQTEGMGVSDTTPAPPRGRVPP